MEVTEENIFGEEQLAYDTGVAEGMEVGRGLGMESGIKLGHEHGWSLGVEMGYYKGCLQSWRAEPEITEKQLITISEIDEQINIISSLNIKDETLQDRVQAIRTQFKKDRLRASKDNGTNTSDAETPSRRTIKDRVKRLFTRNTRREDFNLENLEILETIGEGSFATVTHAQDRVTKAHYAIKMVNLAEFREPEAVTQLEQESHIMELVNGSPFIIKLFHSWEMRQTRCFALEYISGGDMFDVLKRERHFDSPRAARYVSQLAQALDHLHARYVIFRDLKLENILLDTVQDRIRLIDFGLAKLVSKDQLAKTICGTVQYMAPEIIQHEHYDYRVDYWSLGVISFVFFAGRYPFNKGHGQINNDRSEQDRMVMYKRITEGLIEYPPHIPPDAQDVIRELLRPDPVRRLHSFESLDSQEWFIREGVSISAAAAAVTLNDNDRSIEAVQRGPLSPSRSPNAYLNQGQRAAQELNCDNFAQTFIQNHLPSVSPPTTPVKASSPEKVSVGTLPSTSKQNSSSSLRTDSEATEYFFKLLEKFQSQRLDSQRSPGPRMYSKILSMRPFLEPIGETRDPAPLPVPKFAIPSVVEPTTTATVDEFPTEVGTPLESTARLEPMQKDIDPSANSLQSFDLEPDGDDAVGHRTPVPLQVDHRNALDVPKASEGTNRDSMQLDDIMNQLDAEFAKISTEANSDHQPVVPAAPSAAESVNSSRQVSDNSAQGNPVPQIVETPASGQVDQTLVTSELVEINALRQALADRRGSSGRRYSMKKPSPLGSTTPTTRTRLNSIARQRELANMASKSLESSFASGESVSAPPRGTPLQSPAPPPRPEEPILTAPIPIQELSPATLASQSFETEFRMRVRSMRSNNWTKRTSYMNATSDIIDGHGSNVFYNGSADHTYLAPPLSPDRKLTVNSGHDDRARKESAASSQGSSGRKSSIASSVLRHTPYRSPSDRERLPSVSRARILLLHKSDI